MYDYNACNVDLAVKTLLSYHVSCFSVEEYSAAFSSRPRIARTPDVSSNPSTRPTSRGSIGGGSPPTPKYSDSLPTSRPNSGGRPSSGELTVGVGKIDG